MSLPVLPHHHGDTVSSVLSSPPSADEFQGVSDLLRQLGDGSRLRLFWVLCHCEECVMNLSAIMEMSSPALSHHLRLLRTSGLILSRRQGKEVYYRAANTLQARLLHQLIEQLIAISCPSPEGQHEILECGEYEECSTCAHRHASHDH